MSTRHEWADADVALLERCLAGVGQPDGGAPRSARQRLLERAQAYFRAHLARPGAPEADDERLREVLVLVSTEPFVELPGAVPLVLAVHGGARTTRLANRALTVLAAAADHPGALEGRSAQDAAALLRVAADDALHWFDRFLLAQCAGAPGLARQVELLRELEGMEMRGQALLTRAHRRLIRLVGHAGVADALRLLYRSVSWAQRRAMLRDLADPQYASLVRVVVEQGCRPEPATRRAAVETLGAMGSAVAEPFLLRMLEAADEGVRRAAVDALGQTGTRAALPALHRLETDHPATHPAVDAARAAIDGRHPLPVGTGAGGLSLADSTRGGLSLAEAEVRQALEAQLEAEPPLPARPLHPWQRLATPPRRVPRAAVVEHLVQGAGRRGLTAWLALLATELLVRLADHEAAAVAPWAYGVGLSVALHATGRAAPESKLLRAGVAALAERVEHPRPGTHEFLAEDGEAYRVKSDAPADDAAPVVPVLYPAGQPEAARRFDAWPSLAIDDAGRLSLARPLRTLAVATLPLLVLALALCRWLQQG